MKRKLRIAFLTSEYATEPYFDGGLAQYLFRVARGLTNQGHEVEIFTCSDNSGDIVHDNVLVHRMKVQEGFAFRSLSRLTRYRLSESLRIILVSHILRKSLLKRHRQCPFDIVQASNYLATGLLLTLNSPVPVVTRASSYEPMWRTSYGKKMTADQRTVEWLELRSMRQSNAVYAPSRLIADTLRKEQNVAADVQQPPFEVETAELDDSVYRKHLAKRKYFLFFGNIGQLKGCGVLARSLPYLLSSFPDMFFAFSGRILAGPNNKSMMQHIMDLAGPHKDRVIYLGILPHSRLYPVIAHAHAVVLPSLVDNVPNTMLEAMAMGRIVIGSRGASFDEFITDGKSGFLVTPGDHSELRDAMQRIWNVRDEERERIGICARERIARLDSGRMCTELEEYFTAVIHREQQSRSAGADYLTGGRKKERQVRERI